MASAWTKFGLGGGSGKCIWGNRCPGCRCLKTRPSETNQLLEALDFSLRRDARLRWLPEYLSFFFASRGQGRKVMPQHLCPICGRAVDPATSPAMPFCSERCRQIDLGRWLGECYRIPGPDRTAEEAESEETSPPKESEDSAMEEE